MKMLDSFFLYSFASVILLTSSSALAQELYEWEKTTFRSGATQYIAAPPNVRVTKHPGQSRTPDIDIDGSGTVHVVWHDDRDGNWEIFYCQVSSDGVKLTPEIQITETTSTSSSFPQISVSNEGEAHIVWQEEDNDQIYYCKLDAAGEKLVANRLIADSFCKNPDVEAQHDGTVGICWERDGGFGDLHRVEFRRLDHKGNNLGGIKTVVSDIFPVDNDPQMDSDGKGNFFFGFTEIYRIGPAYYTEIFWNKISGGGDATAPVRKEASTKASFPTIAVSPQFVAVLHDDFVNNVYGVYSGPILLVETNQETSWVDLAASKTEEQFAFVWMDDKEGSNEIYYSLVHNSEFVVYDIRVSTLGGLSERPSVAFGPNNTVYVAWQDFRDNDWEIYLSSFEIPKKLELTSPLGEEVWRINKNIPIRWESRGIEFLKIEYSIDNGQSWTIIEESYSARNESFNWTPDFFADEVFIRITDTEDQSVTSQNDIAFSILPKYVGTTIITHGFILDLSKDQDWGDYRWQFAMAYAIADDRQICFIRKGKAYIVNATYDEFTKLDESESIDKLIKDNEIFKALPEGASLEKDRSVVFIFDWTHESDINAPGFLEAAADAFFATLLQVAKDHLWLLKELHFIGHSRGAVVNSEIIQRLLFAASRTTGFLSPDIIIDEDIHMTTLDPHPAGHWNVPVVGVFVFMDDDMVNNFSNSKDNIGVVGWKTATHKVSYIDNYYQENASSIFEGLSYFPGLNTTLSSARRNVSELIWDPLVVVPTSIRLPFGIPIIIHLPLSIPFQYHMRVHNWYFGTVDLLGDRDEFGHGPQIDREAWYQTNGSNEGYFYSAERGDKLSQIASSDDDLIDISMDQNYNSHKLFFNGDFQKRRVFDSHLIPGWSFHGGGGDGLVEDNSDNGINNHLTLQFGETEKRHNYFYIPHDTQFLYYEIAVDNKTLVGNTLELTIGDIQVIHLLNEEHTYKQYYVNVSTIKGTVQTLRFHTKSGIFPTDSRVWIDNIRFLPTNQIECVVASPVTLHAYDTFGNHTGPTSDSSWALDIPGSAYFAEHDSLPHAKQYLTLPDPGDNAEYRIEIVSKNVSGSFDFEIRDSMDSVETYTAFFDSVIIQPQTKASLILSKVRSATTALQMDYDGDGLSDSMRVYDRYWQNIYLNATVEGNGSILPEGRTIVNYGDSLTYSLTPDSGNVIVDLIIDDKSVGSVSEYTLASITENHKIVAVFSTPTGLDETQNLPKVFKLNQNYPNPFNPSTVISFDLPENVHAKLTVFDALGREVAVLLNKQMPPGNHDIEFNAEQLASGVYFYEITAGSFIQRHKMLFLK